MYTQDVPNSCMYIHIIVYVLIFYSELSSNDCDRVPVCLLSPKLKKKYFQKTISLKRGDQCIKITYHALNIRYPHPYPYINEGDI